MTAMPQYVVLAEALGWSMLRLENEMDQFSWVGHPPIGAIVGKAKGLM